MDDVIYINHEGNIELHLDMSVYARPAVMKVLGRWTEYYTISFGKTNTFNALLKPIDNAGIGIIRNPVDDVQIITNDLLQEMIRLDIIKQTADIRKLLVARALYATCIEVDKGANSKTPVSTAQGWEEDSRRIFSSWGGKGD